MTGTEFEAWLSGRGWRPENGRRVLVMGILNVTPDSFSDGGVYRNDPRRAVEEGLKMVSEGADLLDVGGESTRPGSLPVDEAEQVRRVTPVVTGLRDAGVVISVDTTRAAVAEAALDAGAHVVNDISAGRDDPRILNVVARHQAAIILMHMQGTPATMQLDPRYDDVVREVKAFLIDRTRAAVDAGVAPHRILLDPGFGFGKTFDHNLALLRNLKDFTALPHAVVVGTSRKGFLGKIVGEPDPLKRGHATAATTAWAVTNAAGAVRVHEVGPNRDVVRVMRAVVR